MVDDPIVADAGCTFLCSSDFHDCRLPVGHLYQLFLRHKELYDRSPPMLSNIQCEYRTAALARGEEAQAQGHVAGEGAVPRLPGPQEVEARAFYLYK